MNEGSIHMLTVMHDVQIHVCSGMCDVRSEGTAHDIRAALRSPVQEGGSFVDSMHPIG